MQVDQHGLPCWFTTFSWRKSSLRFTFLFFPGLPYYILFYYLGLPLPGIIGLLGLPLYSHFHDF